MLAPRIFLSGAIDCADFQGAVRGRARCGGKLLALLIPADGDCPSIAGASTAEVLTCGRNVRAFGDGFGQWLQLARVLVGQAESIREQRFFRAPRRRDLFRRTRPRERQPAAEIIRRGAIGFGE